ncbi:hypothetical protein [Streptomyces canus]|nr:hypothetical protein [Streptomyces canus]WSD85999.1 hypothetical protein OG925_17600 [Streptomyces canus]
MAPSEALQTADHGRLRQLHRTYVPFSVLIDTKYEEATPFTSSAATWLR